MKINRNVYLLVTSNEIDKYLCARWSYARGVSEEGHYEGRLQEHAKSFCQQSIDVRDN